MESLGSGNSVEPVNPVKGRCCAVELNNIDLLIWCQEKLYENME